MQRSILPVAVAALVALTGLAITPVSHAVPTPVVPGSPSTASAPSATAPASTPGAGASRLRAVEAELGPPGTPLTDFHPPNFAAMDPGRAGAVAPSYSQAPAPMGISDLGLRNVSGVLTPYDYNSSSVWGTATLTHVQTAYVDGDGPDSFGIQLNAVATNVTLYGKDGYQFWTQNFLTYTSSTGELSLGDNVWNFSSAQGILTSNVFASYGPNGHPVPPVYYYAVGPTFTVAYPFTVSLYLNASAYHHRPAVFFNYTITAANGTFGGSFDHVAFASSRGPAHGAPVLPAFQVNGTGYDPIGLPNDFEFVLVGNDDGDTTTVFASDATLALHYWNDAKRAYENVPAAFDAGSDTGESSDGILPVYTVATPGGPPTLSLRAGPSFIEGLWNVSNATNASRQFQLTLRPQNAFMFVSPGSTFDNATAQWVPTLRFGAATTDFVLPNAQNYTIEWLLSDHVPQQYLVNATVTGETVLPTVALAAEAAEGSYTPLLAWGDAELKAISQRGNGTATNPYVLIHRAVGPLDPVFGQMNFFGFPVFAGILLINTTLNVSIVQPQVAITYGAWMAPQLAGLGLPDTNYLQLEFWNVSHVAVANCSGISGWLSANLGAFPEAEVLFWGSTGNVVANNTFHDEGAALTLYGGSANTVWGNTFLPGSVSSALYEGNNTTGVIEWESGDLLYNNYFGVGQPAITPTYDAFSCQVTCVSASYADQWNVSLRPANSTARALWLDLSGSILHTWYQGGNFWSNYGTAEDPLGDLPYDDHGLITVGGDFVPLYPTAVYNVTFVETGLAAGAAWSVSILGVSVNSTGPNATLYEGNGTFTYTAVAPANYLAPAAANVTVDGAGVVVSVTFVETFSVVVGASGLPTGWDWNITFANGHGPGVPVSVDATGGHLAVALLVNGSQPYVARAYGFATAGATTPPRVAGATLTLTVTFTVLYVLRVTATGIGPHAAWTVTVGEGATSVNATAIGPGTLAFTLLQVVPGSYDWVASAIGYNASPSHGIGTSPVEHNATVRFTALAATSPASFPTIDFALAALALLAVVGFALFFWERGRAPKPPRPIAPAPAVAAPAAAAPAAGPAPWEETPADSEKSDPYRKNP